MVVFQLVWELTPAIHHLLYKTSYLHLHLLLIPTIQWLVKRELIRCMFYYNMLYCKYQRSNIKLSSYINPESVLCFLFLALFLLSSLLKIHPHGQKSLINLAYTILIALHFIRRLHFRWLQIITCSVYSSVFAVWVRNISCGNDWLFSLCTRTITGYLIKEKLMPWMVSALNSRVYVYACAVNTTEA